MSRFGSIARQSPAIVISIIALTFSLGGGAGWAASAATSHPATPKTSVTWHKLKLINGWRAFGDGARAPSYAVINGVVYLAGVADTSGNSEAVIAVLPKSARPKYYLELPAFASSSVAPQDVYVAANGDIVTVGYDGLASLDGISFPVGE